MDEPYSLARPAYSGSDLVLWVAGTGQPRYGFDPYMGPFKAYLNLPSMVNMVVVSSLADLHLWCLLKVCLKDSEVWVKTVSRLSRTTPYKRRFGARPATLRFESGRTPLKPLAGRVDHW